MSDPDFDALEAKKRLLAEQLAQQPVVEIIGAIGASALGGWPEDNGSQTLYFAFSAWKTPDGILNTKELGITITTTPEEYRALSQRISAFSAQRIRARVVENSVFGTARAALVELIGPDDDPELQRICDDLKTPVVHHDERLGELTLNRSVNAYRGRARWNWKRIEVSLYTEDGQISSLPPLLAVARTLWADQKGWKKRCVDYAVGELLPLKNEDWLDDGASPVTPSQFRRKLTLESISIEKDLSFEFWFSDGDLFQGHSIQVCGTLTEGPTSADIAG